LLAAAMTPSDEGVPAQRVVDLTRGLPAHVRLEHDALDPAACFAAAFGRVLLNAVLLAAECLQKGGVIRLAGGAQDVFVQIEGPDAAWPAGTAACVTDAAEAQRALSAWQAPQMALTTVIAHETGVRLSVLLAPNPAAQVPILRVGGV
ncbi:MAG TPA: histidine phosphotransferase family protein, partial [Rhodopila sp.]|nr:histidine phosphotransferase family protein [Rhodopila sp.]